MNRCSHFSGLTGISIRRTVTVRLARSAEAAHVEAQHRPLIGSSATEAGHGVEAPATWDRPATWEEAGEGSPFPKSGLPTLSESSDEFIWGFSLGSASPVCFLRYKYIPKAESPMGTNRNRWA